MLSRVLWIPSQLTPSVHLICKSVNLLLSPSNPVHIRPSITTHRLQPTIIDGAVFGPSVSIKSRIGGKSFPVIRYYSYLFILFQFILLAHSHTPPPCDPPQPLAFPQTRHHPCHKHTTTYVQPQPQQHRKATALDRSPRLRRDFYSAYIRRRMYTYVCTCLAARVHDNLSIKRS